MTDKARRMTREEQAELGLIRQVPQHPSSYVPATRHSADLPAHTSHTTTLDITPSAQQVVQVQTSATDRAKGFQLAIIPLAAALGLLIVFVSLAFENEFFSLASLILFWCTFCLCWLIGWVVTLLLSAEGVAFFEAHRKWNIVEREQEERWSHWRWLNGRNSE